MVHPNKSGYIFVYDRADAKIENVWPLVKTINFVKSIDPKTGELIGRRDFSPGKLRASRCARRSPAASAGTPAPTARRPASTTRSATSGA